MANPLTVSSLILGSGIVTVTGGSLYVNGAVLAGGGITQGQFDALSGVVGESGSLLYRMLTGESGSLTSDIINSGASAVAHANGNASNISGNLTATGATLYGYIIGFSGMPVAAGGVTSVNGVTGAVTIAGSGGLRVDTVGDRIIISGLTTTTDKQIVFDEEKVMSGSANLTWDNSVGALNLNQATILVDNPLGIGGSGVYLQINIQNRSTASGASTDIVATSNIGSDTSGYIDLGINGSTYANRDYSIGTSGDGYLYVNGGGLSLGTQTNHVIKFHTSGTTSGNLRATIDNSGINLASGHSYRVNGQLPTFTKGGSFYNLDGISSGIHRTICWYAPFACTASSVRGFILSGTSATVNAIRNNSLNLLVSDLVVSPTGTWVSSGIIQNASFAQGDSLTLHITQTLNGPVSVGIQVDFQKN